MATGCSKWLPAVFRMHFPQVPKMAAPVEDLRWTSRYSAHWNALNGFQCISNGFFISLDEFFALQQFHWNEITSSREAPLYCHCSSFLFLPIILVCRPISFEPLKVLPSLTELSFILITNLQIFIKHRLTYADLFELMTDNQQG